MMRKVTKENVLVIEDDGEVQYFIRQNGGGSPKLYPATLGRMDDYEKVAKGAAKVSVDLSEEDLIK